MITPKDLETALLAFITEYKQSESCDDCIYREFCIRFYTPHSDSPSEWEILEKTECVPS